MCVTAFLVFASNCSKKVAPLSSRSPHSYHAKNLSNGPYQWHSSLRYKHRPLAYRFEYIHPSTSLNSYERIKSASTLFANDVFQRLSKDNVRTRCFQTIIVQSLFAEKDSTIIRAVNPNTPKAPSGKMTVCPKVTTLEDCL